MTDSGNSNKVKILYIGGEGRSGSTLLGYYLGRMDQAYLVGELSWIWQRGFLENELCGCKMTFSECLEWGRTLAGVRPQLSAQAADLNRIWKKYTRTRRLIPEFLRPIDRERDPKLAWYLSSVLDIYRRVRMASGCRFIIDTSKSPAYAFLLNAIPQVELYILHLVRDPRAVAYSRQRRIIRPENGKDMIRFNPAFSALLWATNNLAIEILGAKIGMKGRYQRIRYEDFVERPDQTAKRVIDAMPDLFMPGDIEIDLSKARTYHTVSGNPARFGMNSLQITPDLEWQQKMTYLKKTIVSLVALPLMVRYAYFGKKA